MLCYRDRTFCPFWEECDHGSICKIALTEKVKHDAEVFGLPTCQYLDKPECFEEFGTV